MMVRGRGDVEGNTRARFEERGEINSVQTRRKLAPCMPRKLHSDRKKHTKSINISKITNNAGQFRGKFTITNKILVL
jgi:hypothetical protein